MKRTVLSPFFLLLVLLPLPASAEKRLTLLLAPGLRAQDIAALAALRSSVPMGACGWMVCRAAGRTPKTLRADRRDYTASLLLTLGAGARLLAPAPRSPVWCEPVRLPDGAFTLPAPLMAQISRLNRSLGYPALPGLLGDTLRQAGWHVQVISDAVGGREAAEALLMAAGRTGRAGSGHLHCTLSAPLLPYGKQADTTRMVRLASAPAAAPTAAVLTFWQLQRAQQYSALCLPAAAAQHRKAALHALNCLWSGLLQNMKQGDLLCLLSPGPSIHSPSLNVLAPLLVMGEGAGMLSSPSTRRQGLVVNTDFLPSICSALHIAQPAGLIGRAEETSGPGRSAAEWSARYRKLLAVSRQQNVLGGLPTLQLLLALGGGIAFWLNKKALAAAAGGALAALPAGMLLLPLPAGGSMPAACVLLACWEAAFALLAGRLALAGKACKLVNGLFLLFCVPLVLDMAGGAHLAVRSWLGPSVMEAARFYGIGNEWMGALFGALVSIIPLAHASRAGKSIWAAWALFAVACAAWPGGGAKVGAIPTGVFTLGCAWFVWQHEKLRVRDLAGMTAAAAAFLALFAAADRLGGSKKESQLGRAFAHQAGGSLAEIALRKLAMGFHLLLHSPWCLVMTACGVFLLFLPGRTPGREWAGVQAGMAAGVLACLLFNDAGVAAAALLLAAGLSMRLCICADFNLGQTAAAERS